MGNQFMRIAHVFTVFPHEYQPYNERLIERLEDGGVENIIMVTGSSPGRYKNIPLFEIRYWKNNWRSAGKIISLSRSYAKEFSVPFVTAFKLILRYFPIVNNQEYVYHFHHLTVLNDSLFNLLKWLGVKWGISLRGYDIAISPLLNERKSKHLTEVLRHACFVHVVSKSLGELAVNYGASPEKIKSIHRAPEVSELIPRQTNQGEKLRLTTICRFNWKKGLVFALLAIDGLKKKGINLQYDIIGDGNENERAELYYWRNLLGLDKEVIFHGFQEEGYINEYLSKTDIYLQPSINEGIPNTLKRVVYYGIPTVATYVDGIPELINNPQLGILVPPGDPTAIINAVMEVYSNIHNYGETGFQTINIEQEIEEYRNMYKRVLREELEHHFQ